MADAQRDRDADRHLRRPLRRHESERPRRAARRAAQAPGKHRADGGREDADLCARPRPRVLRRAGHPQDHAGRHPHQLHRHHYRHRQQRAVPDEEIAVMIVTKRALPRRTFLRGAGAALALPLLDSMIPAFTPVVKAAANPARRLGFFYVPNGHIDDERWTPATEGAFELTPILQSLAPVHDQTIVITGLAHKTGLALGDGNGDHSRATPTWLSGVHPKKTEAGDVRGGMTADQIAAAAIGKETPLASLELGLDGDQGIAGACENGYSCIYTNTISWRTDTQALPAENNPGTVFERLFGDGGSPAQRRLQMRNNQSILDSVTGELARLS